MKDFDVSSKINLPHDEMKLRHPLAHKICERFKAMMTECNKAKIYKIYPMKWGRIAARAGKRVVLTDKQIEENLKVIILDERFSHVSIKSWCGKLIMWCYFHSLKSPSGVLLAYSVEETEERMQILNSIKPGAYGFGPQRGDMAKTC